MAKIKITSNPYIKQISFQRYIEEEEDWIDITHENHPNGKLVKEEIRTGFFPFIVKDIVDIVYDDYYDGSGSLDIVFEGTSDEYRQLENVCQEDKYEGVIKLYRSELKLGNASDILPEIIDIYRNIESMIKPLEKNNAQLEEEIKKFLDASNDQIPVCIFGNYSCGKSTFINALIGNEILPSGDEPVTGKIYKITRSMRPDIARISFGVNNILITVSFQGNETLISGQSDDPLSTDIKNLVESSGNLTMQQKISAVIQMIEKHVKKDDEHTIDDLIDLKIPFNKGLWDKTKKQFVFFDTPGSNSASNVEHVTVMQKAMASMSNGMPVFVSEFNKLDSTDNEDLYKTVKEMKELDSRFTMIVVNKADGADLEEDQEGKVGLSDQIEKKTMNLALPKNMYGEGIFFVSSILGIGSKTDGEFESRHYARVFAQNSEMYSNAMSRYYQRLYRFNIMPKQLKNKSVETAEMVQNNLLYANSGLYSIEEELVKFADNYSSYNKCFQSEKFLNKVIELSAEDIEKSKAELEEERNQLYKKMDEDRKDLIAQVDTYNYDYVDHADGYYPIAMADFVQRQIDISQERDITIAKAVYLREEENNLKKDSYIDNTRKAISSIMPKFQERLVEGVRNIDFQQIGEAFKKLGDDTGAAVQSGKKYLDVRSQIELNAEESIIDQKNHDYEVFTENAYHLIKEKSIAYWDGMAVEYKKGLNKLVTGSEILNEEQRKILSDIILNYVDVAYKDISDIEKFTRKRFEYQLIPIPGLEKQLSLTKLESTYNTQVGFAIRGIAESFEESHKWSFKVWARDLMIKVESNIIDFNPVLKEQNDRILRIASEINVKENNLRLLNEYQKEIAEKMEFQINDAE